MRRTRFSNVLFSSLVAAVVVACGGGSGGENGGGNLAGIGGTGITASGVITGFGSVFVNGIEFETDQAGILVNNTESNEGALRIGMVVTIEGTVNDNGVTGTANSIVYEAELVGPVSNAPVADPDNLTKTFDVLGITVVVERNSTVFEGDGFSNFGVDNIA